MFKQMTIPIIISYFTRNTPYEKVMNTHLLPSLKKFDLPYDIEAVEDFGNWQKNTSYKAQFVFQKLLQHQRTVVFIDSDATIEQYPSLFTQIPPEFDIACHYQNYILQWRGRTDGKRFDLLSGTLMFRYNEKVLSLVRKWIERTKTSNKWEQIILQKLTEENKDIKIFSLPVTYCTVNTHKNEIPSYIKKEEVVIRHWQASRKYKSRRKGDWTKK